MKKLFVTAIALLGLFTVNAQENVIKANPLSVLGGTDLLSYERKISDHSSVVIGSGIGSFKIGDVKYSSLGGELQYRYYFSEALRGFYGGAQLGYQTGKVEIKEFSFDGTSDIETKFGAFRAGGKAGYQWVWDSGFSLDLNLGVAYSSFTYDDKGGSFSILKASGMLPTFGFGLGYAF